MSAKILTSLTDENPNMQKQIGCMNGIFQLFDRHHFLTSRRLTTHNQKKLLPGPNHNAELTVSRHEAMERNGKETVNEKHRTSTESSRSSSSSSFSSLDHHTTFQSTPFSSTKALPQTMTIKPQNPSMPPGRQSIDLRDVVKDSMYRDARGISIKTVAKEDGKSYVMKHIDSPRPLQKPNSCQPRVTGSDGTVQAPAKHREAPWMSREEKDRRFQLRPKDPPRFSYDGRELRDEAKSSMKLKELPRLSLDSRDIRSPARELRASSLLRDLSGEKGSCPQILNLNEEPSSNKRSSVIAKLMGLEGFPDHVSTEQSKNIMPDEDSTRRSSHAADESRLTKVPLSPRLIQKDPSSPRTSKTSSVKKTISTPRFPLEQAPWKQQDSSKESHNLAMKNREVPRCAPHAPSSVYGEIEKRITDLEFKRSGKDLRALKQILEAMQKTRQRLEDQKGEVDLESQISRCSSEYGISDQDSKSPMWQNRQSNHQALTIKGPSPWKRAESSTIIMTSEILDKSKSLSSSPAAAADLIYLQKLQTQDAKCTRVDSADKRITQDQRSMRSNNQDHGWNSSSGQKNKGRTSKVVSASRKTTHDKGEYFTAPPRSSGTMSPRSQQKKQGIDRPSNTNNPSSYMGTPRMQSNKIQGDSVSISRKFKLKPTYLQRGDDKTRELKSEIRNCNHQDDTASMHSKRNKSSAQMDTDAFSTDQNDFKQQRDFKDRDLALRLRKDMSIADLAIPSVEQPSPVSVLDATFDREESPSPIKKKSTAFTDDEWNLENMHHMHEIRRQDLGLEFNNEKMQNIEDLVHRLKLLNRGPDEATTDDVVSLCEESNPDHRYITKILLASGLLKDVCSIPTPVQLHPSGHVINPKLFHVLEQTEERAELVDEDVNSKSIQPKVNKKVHRRIVFDTVDEILVRKLHLENSIFLGGRCRRGQELLKELKSEVDSLQTMSNCSQDDEDDQLASIFRADMTYPLDGWADYRVEMPALVLDVERLIFKDLINEVINDQIDGHQNWPRRHCRQLFTK